jgi:hypothetical protein
LANLVMRGKGRSLLSFGTGLASAASVIVFIAVGTFDSNDRQSGSVRVLDLEASDQAAEWLLQDRDGLNRACRHRRHHRENPGGLRIFDDIRDQLLPAIDPMRPRRVLLR